MLRGHTEHGAWIQMVFLDDELQGFDTTVSFSCPSQGARRVWRYGFWSPTPRAGFRLDGRRFRVRDRFELPDYDPPAALDYTMTGELADDRSSAKGTLSARAVFGRGHGSMYCHGRVSFQAAAGFAGGSG